MNKISQVAFRNQFLNSEGINLAQPLLASQEQLESFS